MPKATPPLRTYGSKPRPTPSCDLTGWELGSRVGRLGNGHPPRQRPAPLDGRRACRRDRGAARAFAPAPRGRAASGGVSRLTNPRRHERR
jgi:hypothetical protein